MSRLYQVSFFHLHVILSFFGGITQTSRYRVEATESNILLTGTLVLLAFTISTAVIYYRRISRAKGKYEEAKDAVGDIVVSFNKQLQKHEDQLERAGYRIETISAKNENTSARIEEMGKLNKDLISKVANASESQNALSKEIQEMKMKLDSLEKAQKEMEKHVSEPPETKIEAAIPIRKDHALAPLTGTELRVLEFIAEANEKTAPEIRDMTKLTREHSARLVKKLYEEGYLERDTAMTPYRYRVKDEMLKILKKSAASA